MEVGAELLAAVARSVGVEVGLVGATGRGESRSTFVLTSALGDLVLKLVPNVAGVLDDQHRLVRLVEGLRRRGCPAPEYVGVGVSLDDDVVFTVQRRLPGETLEPGPGERPPAALFARVLPDLLDAVELQRDAGDLDEPPWPRWLLDTIYRGGVGYCLHDTMRRRSDTAALLERLVAIAERNSSGPVRSSDVLHFDLSPANVLHQEGRLSGVVDWNVPFTGAAQGDRGFDLATLLFYGYDLDATRADLWNAATAVSGPQWTAVYLCHLALRQVEWTIRHRPGAPEEARFLRIATRALTDCEQRGL